MIHQAKFSFRSGPLGYMRITACVLSSVQELIWKPLLEERTFLSVFASNEGQ